MSDGQRDLFISYSHADSAAATGLDALLTLAGAKTFLDTKDISGGDNLVASVFEGIASSKNVAVLVSKHSRESAWVREEYSAARMGTLSGEGTRVIPVLLDGTPDLIPTALRALMFRDLRGYVEDRAVLRTCARQLLSDIGLSENQRPSTLTKSVLQNRDAFLKCLEGCRTLYGYASLGNPLPFWLPGSGRKNAEAMGKYLWDTDGVQYLNHALVPLMESVFADPEEHVERAANLVDAATRWRDRDSTDGSAILDCERESLYHSQLLSVLLVVALGDVAGLLLIDGPEPSNELGDVPTPGC